MATQTLRTYWEELMRWPYGHEYRRTTAVIWILTLLGLVTNAGAITLLLHAIAAVAEPAVNWTLYASPDRAPGALSFHPWMMALRPMVPTWPVVLLGLVIVRLATARPRDLGRYPKAAEQIRGLTRDAIAQPLVLLLLTAFGFLDLTLLRLIVDGVRGLL